MPELIDTTTHTAPAVLDIGDDIGALVISTNAALHGQEIEVSPVTRPRERIHTAVLARKIPNGTSYAALFLALPAGDYIIWSYDPTVPTRVNVTGGMVAEVDWRASGARSVPNSKIGHGHTHAPPMAEALPPVTPEMLPPRYQQGQPVCATPMGSAALRYDMAGKVAWDQIWTNFCDLALAGGPPHRATVLEPGTPEDILAQPEAYATVVAEIERGLRLVTRLPTRSYEYPGWVCLVCVDDAMAAWLHHAITYENVAVRHAGHLLYFPAGPTYELEKEIKNVITVAAKTHHYWCEHARG